MLEKYDLLVQSERLPSSEVPVEFIDALLYNGDMKRDEILALDELVGWNINRLNAAIELGKKAETIVEREDGLIMLNGDTARSRIACYG
jgi:hypothetical protein